mgnify:CR=1 FL=1
MVHNHLLMFSRFPLRCMRTIYRVVEFPKGVAPTLSSHRCPGLKPGWLLLHFIESAKFTLPVEATSETA